jgi:hypothetical protein
MPDLPKFEMPILPNYPTRDLLKLELPDYKKNKLHNFDKIQPPLIAPKNKSLKKKKDKSDD